MSNADIPVDPSPSSAPPPHPPPSSSSSLPTISTSTTANSSSSTSNPPRPIAATAAATLPSPTSRLAALRLNPLEYALAAARSSVAAPSTTSTTTTTTTTSNAEDGNPTATATTSSPDSSPARTAQRARRLAFMQDLIRSLDIVVYAQLSVMYYMDCSLLRLVLRLIVQWVYFTPKPILPQLVGAPAQPRGAVLEALFLLCLFNHVVFPAPAAGEAMRGYLHGGLLIDFVGVKGPVSKWRLAIGDVIVLLLQWVLVGLVAEVKRVKARAEDGNGSASGSGRGSEGDRIQDVEAEEKSLEKGIEEGEDDDNKNDHPLDQFYGGQVVVADIHILDAIKRAWRWQRPEAAS